MSLCDFKRGFTDAYADLTCDHEECDTWVLLHAQHAAQDHHTVVIKSLNTDLAVIALSLEKDLPWRLYFHTGVANRTRITDVAKVTSALGTSSYWDSCLVRL